MTDTIVASGVSLNDLEDLDAAKCQFPHQDSRCTQIVRWSYPPDLCGCFGRLLACQGSYDYRFDSRWDGLSLRCGLCGHVAHVEDWRKGWYPV